MAKKAKETDDIVVEPEVVEETDVVSEDAIVQPVEEVQKEPEVTVEVKLSDEEILAAKQKAYEEYVARNKVGIERAVDSRATTLSFMSVDDIKASIEELKIQDPPLFPEMVDIHINELKRRGVDTTEYQAYFDGIEYKKPWLKL